MSIPKLIPRLNPIMLRQLTRHNPPLTPMPMLIIDIKVLPDIKRRTALHMPRHKRNLRTLVILAPVKDPRQGGDNQHDREGDDAVVHAAAGDRDGGGEDEQHGCDDGVDDAEDVTGPAEGFTELEGTGGGELGAQAEAVD